MNQSHHRLLPSNEINIPSGTNIVDLVSTNSTLIIAKSDCSILILNKSNGGRLESYDRVYVSDSKNDSIQKMYLDDSGTHLVIILSSGDSIYLNTLSLASKKIPKEVGFLVFVTFLKDNCIIASNSNGIIFEIHVDHNCSKINYESIYQIESTHILTSMHIEYLNLVSGENIAMMIFTVCCSHSTRLYHSFSFDCSNSSILARNLFKASLAYIEFPMSLEQMNVDSSKLFVRQINADAVTISIEFALISGNDVYHGSINTPCNSNDDLIISANLIVTPSTAIIHQDHQRMFKPKHVYLTSHHIIVVNFENKIDIIHKLSNEKVIENFMCFEDTAQTIGVRFDSKTQDIYIFTDTSLKKISIANEDLMNVVKTLSITNEFKMFDFFTYSNRTRSLISNNIALSQLTSMTNLSLDEMVLRILNIFPLAFELYIRDVNSQVTDSVPRCTTALKFMLESQNIHEILMNFLTCLFSKMSLSISSIKCQPQHTMIATWLCELYLHELVLKLINLEHSNAHDQVLVKDEYDAPHIAVDNGELINRVNSFLQNNRNVFDFHTTLRQFLERGSISSSYTNNSEFSNLLLQYFKYTADTERLVYYLIQMEKYLDVIQFFKESKFDEKLAQQVYRWSHVLIEKDAEAMLDMILMKKSHLKLENLIPAWLNYCNHLESDNLYVKESGIFPVNHAVRFVKECFDSLMTDFPYSSHLNIFITTFYSLIFILCKYDDSFEEKSLISALSFDCDPVNGSLPLMSTVLNASLLKDNAYSSDNNLADYIYDDQFSPKSNPYIDYFYVLNICQTYKKQRGVICTYLLLGMHMDAVEVSLSYGNVNLAKSIAKRHVDKNTRRKLWLIIAQYTADVDKDNQKPHKILSILRESENALHIQDIINMVPDFTEVSLFKEDICQQLETYSKVIDNLKLEMQELTESSQHISQEVEQGYRYSFTGHQKCECCYESLFSKDEIYVFPCCHGYHVYCLLKRLRNPLMKYLDESQLVSLSKLEEQILYYSQSDIDNENSKIHLEFLKNELDGYIAADCLLCGFYAIDSVSRPLLSDYSEIEKSSWNLSEI